MLHLASVVWGWGRWTSGGFEVELGVEMDFLFTCADQSWTLLVTWTTD